MVINLKSQLVQNVSFYEISHQGLFDAVLIETNTTDYFSSERESTLTFELDPKGFYHFGPLHFLQAGVLLAALFSIHNSLFDPGHKTLQSKSASRSTLVRSKCSTNKYKIGWSLTRLVWDIQKTLPKALRTQVLTALTSNFGLVQYAW